MGAFNLDQTFIREYDRSWNFLYQQDTSFLRTTVRNERQASEKKAYTFISPTQGVKNRARASLTQNTPTQHQRTWVTMDTWTWSELVEDMDVIKTLSDPSSAYLKNAVSAAHRFYDEQILYYLGSIAYRGKDGAQTVNKYDIGECQMIDGAGNLVGVATANGGDNQAAGSQYSNATSTGLTLKKIATIGKQFDNANVPARDRHLVANADQKWYLLGSTKVGSVDYNTARALFDGTLNEYLGFTFHWLPSDRFTVDPLHTSYPAYQCYAYHKDSFLLSIGMEMKTRLTEESSSNYAVRVFAETMVGGARLQGPGVVPIALLEAPAPDFSQS
jgi:hypothetical protein